MRAKFMSRGWFSIFLRCPMNVGMVIFLGLWLPSHVWAVQDVGPSFDCSRAVSIVEKEICLDKRLSQLDKEMAEKYKKMVGSARSSDKNQVAQEQRKWLLLRDDCAKSENMNKCLAEKLTARIGSLEEGIYNLQLGSIIDLIEENPEKAGYMLKKGRQDEIYDAWYSYFLRFGPAHDEKSANRILLNLLKNLSNDDFGKVPVVKTNDDFLYVLRLVTEEANMPWPCSVMKARGLAAWKAVEPRFGSLRDLDYPVPDCATEGALLASGAWKSVEALFSSLQERAWVLDGTEKYAKNRIKALHVMLSAVDPRLMLKGNDDLDRMIDKTRTWTNPRWIDSGWLRRLNDQLNAAIEAWSPLLVTRYQLTGSAARTIARSVVAAGLNDLLYEIDVGIDLKNDTSIPAELRGKWVVDDEFQKNFDEEQWGILFDKSNELSVEFNGICFGGKCDGYEAVLDEGKWEGKVDAGLIEKLTKYVGDKKSRAIKKIEKIELIVSNRQAYESVGIACIDGDLLFVLDENSKVSIVFSRMK
ncbi:MAG: lysozyme inhibitor LprI family protein [Leptothrix sp. (in: b-proteobacteria)]